LHPLLAPVSGVNWSGALVSGHLGGMWGELSRRRVAGFLVVVNRPINSLCRVSLVLSIALCLRLRLFVFRLLRLKRFSTLTLKVLGFLRFCLGTWFVLETAPGLKFL